MYQSYFQFDARPFSAAPQSDFYVPLESWEETLRTVARVVERGEGPALVIGGAGTGKSLLCHLLAAHYAGAFQVAMVSSTQLCTSRALLQHLLFELGLPYGQRSEGELRFSLLEALAPGPDNQHGMLLIVDEAQNLSSRLLEEIRMLTNYVRGGESRVRLVLAGNTRLEEQFAHPRMESFNQRLACRCYLESLTAEETTYYIRTQLQSVSAGALIDMFDERAMAAVHELTDGVPRLVNQLCDRALLAAAAQQVNRIDQRTVDLAWADLQQLPPTFTTEEPVAGSADVIEFGQLDDVALEPDVDVDNTMLPMSDTIELEPLPETVESANVVDPAQEVPAPGEEMDALVNTDVLPWSDDPAPGPADEFLPLVDSCPADPGLETDWIVQVPFDQETSDNPGGDSDVLIIRRDDQHDVAPGHPLLSAEALERQRQLLDRFRQV